MSYFSKAQQVLLRMAMVLAIVVGTASIAIAATATWDPNPEPDVAGYKVSYGIAPGVYTTTIDVGKVTTYQFNPPAGYVYYVVVQAYNTAGEMSAMSAEAVIDISLPTLNKAPTLTQPANQSSTLNSSASLVLSAADPEGMPLTFGAVGLPPGLSINSASGLIAGVASVKGTYQVTATVSDGLLSASRSFSWVVTAAPNQPPTLTQPANQSTTVNVSASLALSATDPEGMPLIFSAVALPPGLSINSALGTIAGIPSAKGTYQVTVTVSDGSLSASRVFTWTIVEPVTTPPNTSSAADMAFDLGANGVWLRYADAGWRKLHSMNPEEMASGDVDGNGQADLIVDFPGQGLWIWLNDSAWVQLDTWNSGAMVAADFDGNGKSAVLFDFPGWGLWVWRYGGEWSQLDWRDPHAMVAGDLDGNGRAEAVIDFAGSGVWVWKDNQTWSQLHGQDVNGMAVGDLDGNGRKDVLFDFPGAGIWAWSNNTSWWQLHSLGASLMTTGDLDGNGRDEAVIDFPGNGVWAWNQAAWTQLDTRDAETLTAANIDGNGRTDLAVDFGAAGLWVWWNNSNWTQLQTTSPEGSVAGRFKQR
jgi:hypothetical protein